MARAIAIINALLWVALGGFCVYAAFEEGRVGVFGIVVVMFGAGCIVNGLACICGLRLWRISSRVLGAIMVLYGLDVLLLGHGEDIGGAGSWFALIGASIGLGVWSVALPSCRACRTGWSQQAEAPNERQ